MILFLLTKLKKKKNENENLLNNQNSKNVYEYNELFKRTALIKDF